jgi:hypothetical protein
MDFKLSPSHHIYYLPLVSCPINKNPFLIHLKTTTFPANISTFFLNSSATQLLGTWKNKYQWYNIFSLYSFPVILLISRYPTHFPLSYSFPAYIYRIDSRQFERNSGWIKMD